MQQTSTGVSWVASTRGWKFHMFIIYVGSRGRLDCSNVILITSYNNSSIVRTVWYIGSTGSSCHTSHTVWKREKERQKDREREREREREIERERERDLWWRGWWQIQFTGWTVVILPWRSAGSSRVRDWRAEYWSGGCTAHSQHQRAAGRQIMVVGDNTPPWTADSDSLCLPSPQPAMWPTREMWYHQ